MSEQAPTKDQVSLDDLKRAIERVHSIRMRGIIHSTELSSVELDAWRTAYEWHVQLIERHAALSEEINAHLTDWIAIDREEEEGKALIREKLR